MSHHGAAPLSRPLLIRTAQSTPRPRFDRWNTTAPGQTCNVSPMPTHRHGCSGAEPATDAPRNPRLPVGPKAVGPQSPHERCRSGRTDRSAMQPPLSRRCRHHAANCQRGLRGWLALNGKLVDRREHASPFCAPRHSCQHADNHLAEFCHGMVLGVPTDWPRGATVLTAVCRTSTINWWTSRLRPEGHTCSSAVRGPSDSPPAPAQLRQPAPRVVTVESPGVSSFGGRRAAIPVLLPFAVIADPDRAVPRVRRRVPGRHHHPRALWQPFGVWRRCCVATSGTGASDLVTAQRIWDCPPTSWMPMELSPLCTMALCRRPMVGGSAHRHQPPWR